MTTRIKDFMYRLAKKVTTSSKEMPLLKLTLLHHNQVSRGDSWYIYPTDTPNQYNAFQIGHEGRLGSNSRWSPTNTDWALVSLVPEANRSNNRRLVKVVNDLPVLTIKRKN